MKLKNPLIEGEINTKSPNPQAENNKYFIN